MLINKTKSGFMRIRGERLEGEIDGYPVVGAYKYLGCWMDGELGVKEHLKGIGKKIAYITWRFFPFRSKGNMRFNNNMFKLVIEPLYRLAKELYGHATAAEKEEFEVHRRVRWKRFCSVPINTSTRIVERMIQRFGRKAGARERVDEEGEERIKTIPERFTEFTRKIYMSKCQEHRHVTTTTHLREGHGVRVYSDKLLMMYQRKELRAIVRSRISSVIKIVENLRTTGGRRRGRPART